MTTKIEWPDYPFTLNGSNTIWMLIPGVRYDYKDASRCPRCLGVGIPWGGWFHCDGTCGGIAWIESGEFFLPVGEKQEDPEG